ncbi:MAG: hypothetical protein WAS36_01370 [Candidatus Saccharimonadales bacterium]
MLTKKNPSSYIVLLLPWAAFLLFMSTTHPATLPVYALLIPFVLLGLAVYVTLRMLMSKLMGQSKHQKIVTILITLFLVTCVGLQSVGQLTFRDFLTVLFLALLGYFYVYRNIVGAKQ